MANYGAGVAKSGLCMSKAFVICFGIGPQHVAICFHALLYSALIKALPYPHVALILSYFYNAADTWRRCPIILTRVITGSK